MIAQPEKIIKVKSKKYKNNQDEKKEFFTSGNIYCIIYIDNIRYKNTKER